AVACISASDNTTFDNATETDESLPLASVASSANEPTDEQPSSAVIDPLTNKMEKLQVTSTEIDHDQPQSTTKDPVLYPTESIQMSDKPNQQQQTDATTATVTTSSASSSNTAVTIDEQPQQTSAAIPKWN